MLRLTLPASWNIAILTIFCLGYFDSSLYPVSSDDIKNVATDRCYRSFILKADLPNCSRMILEFARTDIRFSLRFPTILKEIDVLLDLHLYKKKGGKEKKKKGRRMVMSGLWATWKSMGRENVHFSKVKSSRARRGHPSRSYDENGKKFRSVSKRERISTIMLLELKCASTFCAHPRSVHCPLSFYWNILYIHADGESC